MNKKGFSLAEVLIALGVVSLLLLGVNKLVLNALKVTSSIEAKNEYNSLVQNMEFVLKDKSLCSSALYNQNKEIEKSRAIFAPEKTIELKNLLFSIRLQQTTVAELGQQFHGFYISQLTLTEIDSTKRQNLSSTQTKYLAKIHLEGLKTGLSPLGNKFTHDFLLWVTTKDSAIETCEMKSGSDKTQEIVQVKPTSAWVAFEQVRVCKAGPVFDINSDVSLSSPEEVCQKAGYNSYTGACKSLNVVTKMETQGSLVATKVAAVSSPSCIPADAYWKIICFYGTGTAGNPAGSMPTHIRCSM